MNPNSDLCLDGLQCTHCGSSSMVGVEVRAVYDGVLFWQCQGCGGTQHRWSQHDGNGRLHDLAETYIHSPIWKK